MSLREQLEQLRFVSDLKKLFVERMNFSPSSGSVMSAISDKVREEVISADIIAEQNEFKVIHCSLNKLLKGTERPVIEQLSTYYQTNMVVFTDSDCSECHFTNLRPIKKGQDQFKLRLQPFRRFVIGPNERLRTAGDRLALLILDGDESAGKVQFKCDQAFDVEAVSRDFYKDFVEYYKGFRDLLMKENRLNQIDADEHTQTIFNRLFFLYFIQKKGYLNCDLLFIVNNLDHFGNGNYYHDFILPLFQKLAVPDYRHKDFEQVPFLNGGLFEFSDSEKNLKISNHAFETIINGLFEHYNFTVREDTEFEKEIAIDPEMMGTIFERLVLGLESKEFEDIPDPRRATGSYYTPKFIVAFMVKQSLLNDLATNLKDIPRCHIRELIYKLSTKDLSNMQLTAIRQRLLDVKIVDPAVGSGAYPVGVLLKIVEIVEIIDRIIKPEKPESFNYRYDLKKEIIECCIYGVDFQERAVALSHLRLWLSLIVDLDAKDIVDVPPLPNLDFHILCGNSLVSKVAGYSYNVEKRIKTSQKELDLIDKFGKLKAKHSTLTTQAEKTKSKARMAAMKTDILIWFLNELVEEQERRIADIEGQRGLFAENEVSRQKKLDLTKPHRNKIEEIKTVLTNAGQLSEKFNWGLDFFDIIIQNGGFDIVVANPPYGVRVEDEIRKEFGVQSKDSYGVFTVLGLRILKPGGTLCYIMSDTWQTIRSHKNLRDILLKEVDAQYLISLPPDVFAATVNTGVYTFVKRIKPRLKIENEADNWLLAADFSPLKIHNGDRWDSADLEAAFELLIERESCDETRDGYTIESNREFAIFAYRQKLIPRFSNHSFFIASPKLFGLMRDVGNQHLNISDTDKLPFYQIDFNGKELEFYKLGDIAQVKHGLTTGDNYSYIFKKGFARGSYKKFNPKLVLFESEMNSLTDTEKLDGFDENRFDGKYLVPYDKGGSSDAEEGWLPKYFVQTDYYIDWRKTSVDNMKKLVGHRHDNPDYYYKTGITFSSRGIYSPTFRLSSKGPFDKESAFIFIKNRIYHNLGIFNSRFILFIYRSYIQHTVSAEIDSIKIIPIIFKINGIEEIVKSIIDRQKKNDKYDYMTNEQLEIDRLVYQMYNLNDDDIKEVEDWYFRRYPKLANVIEAKIKAKAAEPVA
ncbi:N-6 DNA methylase [bacterium]|nr:N-6 DNA methylase [bacterium]